MKGKSKAGHIEVRKNAVKEAAVREYVKEVNELKKNQKDDNIKDNSENKDYDVLSRFKVKRKNNK